MFTIGETRPDCDANEPREDAQVTRQIRRGRLNNETGVWILTGAGINDAGTLASFMSELLLSLQLFI